MHSSLPARSGQHMACSTQRHATHLTCREMYSAQRASIGNLDENASEDRWACVGFTRPSLLWSEGRADADAAGPKALKSAQVMISIIYGAAKGRLTCMVTTTQPISLLKEVTGRASLLPQMVIITHWSQSGSGHIRVIPTSQRDIARLSSSAL
jgi:hypothetical protein